jgi:hypothetical protein
MKTELILTLQLALELADDNIYIKKELEKSIESAYNALYAQDPQMVINLINAKYKLISNIAKLKEPDAFLLSDIVDEVVSNIDKFRENRTLYLSQLL